jgi:carbamoyl-phosphate synthase large subunit
MWYLGEAFRNGYDAAGVFNLTKIDPWFLAQIEDIVKTEAWVASQQLADICQRELRVPEAQGFL